MIRTTILTLALACMPTVAAAQSSALSLDDALGAVDELADLKQRAEAPAIELEARGRSAGMWPGVGVSAGFSDVPGVEQQIQLNVSQTVPISGAPALRERALFRDAEAARQRGEAAIQAYKGRVAEVFFEGVYRNLRLELIDEQIEATRRSEQLLERRERAGDASEFEVERVAREVRRLEASRARELADRNAARDRLAALLQRDSAVPEGVLDTRCGGTIGTPAQLAALEADAGAAEVRAEVADRGWIPALQVQAGGMFMADGGGPLEPGFRVGLGVVFPFWGTASALREAADARASTIAANRRLEQELMRREAAAIAARCAALLESADTIEAGIPKTQKLLERAEAGYAAGELTLLELLDAQQAVLAEKLDLLDARWSARRAQNRWLTRTGGW
jgi:outer membrane protein TolC